MLRAIVIDDEQPGIETMRILAGRNPDKVRIVASTLDPGEGLTLIEDYRPDIVFLDISMPAMNGFELLNRLAWRGFKLVFTTAHREYAIEAIKNRAHDYLLKPVDDGEFKKCITDIYAGTITATASAAAAPALLEVPVKDGIEFLTQQHIIRLEASRSYTIFFMDEKIKHLASGSLKDFEQRLNSRLFYRCHHSHIINLQKVRKFINHNGLYALMGDGSRADISKKNRDAFLERLKNM